ncbi:N-acetylmuramoyl-L-alanine amidase [Phenylobacterium sp.]|jgi:N-acetylmuramoyl-L-alanine amidase|uniref:N-acetylmuramoyl-L-alanine amidase n=1 Tax=Phenylobacterium sp. TaxID=1871053 RepID=UPI002E2F6368|nr:N-acetylmuramoyl-L-alanine amidase [Phenylobacterium sp.]HEX2561328.1 N-acetylmuramoyl-L-alanine amidase [Phenylobacterium sp.]
MLARVRGLFRRSPVRFGVMGLAAVAALTAFAASQAGATPPGVKKVRVGGSAAETRIVIDLDSSASGRVSSDGSGDRRVVVALPGVNVDQPLQGGRYGLVKSWVLDESGGSARLRLDLASEASIKRRFLLPPADGIPHYRYVIDLAAANPAAAKAAAAPQLTSRPTQVRAAPLRLQKVVVIDAGHGGKDPGAHGQKVVEKDLTLAAAQALKARLEREGRYKVVLTRSTDQYVPLESRVQIARRADADLFISLHADAGTEDGLRGASVYTLSDKAAHRSAKFVNKEDWFMSASASGEGVRDILLDLTQRATKNRSAAFAEVLLDGIDDHTPLLRRSHREAGLAVLLAPDVPAVLLEMGFLTNGRDEANLRDKAHRSRLMNAVGDAIDAYFSEQTKLAAR